MSAIPDSGAVLALVRLLPALAAIAVAAAPPAATAPRVETVATRLEIPCEIAFLPGGRALVTERPGRMRLLDRRGRLRKAPVARVPVRAYGEGGMLGLALDLAFRANRLVYFYFTATGDGRFIAPLRVYRAPIAPSGATFVAAGARAGRATSCSPRCAANSCGAWSAATGGWCATSRSSSAGSAACGRGSRACTAVCTRSPATATAAATPPPATTGSCGSGRRGSRRCRLRR